MLFFFPALVLLSSFYSATALECLVINKRINFIEFVNDPTWEFCDIQLARSIDDLSASGISEKNDETAKYHALMDAELLGGSAIFHQPFLVEETIIYNQLNKMERCIHMFEL